MEFICSDYSAIEAVVIAELAGETWRQEVFRTHGKIYEMSASKISGVPFEEFARYKAETGMHHPLRKKLGKVAELASGYQGWINAWLNFGAGDHMCEEEIKRNILKWRKESPMIVALWKGLESSAIRAVESPGEIFTYRELSFELKGDVLYCHLPSGRAIAYHEPEVVDVIRYEKKKQSLSYMGVDAKTKQWLRTDTHGGKLTENVVQAVSRDIFAGSLVRLERAGYSIVLHTHDEPTAEVPQGFGSIEEFEAIMENVEPWCAEWPIRAAGGWRGFRYRKE
jgi:DNA polymerase